MVKLLLEHEDGTQEVIETLDASYAPAIVGYIHATVEQVVTQEETRKLMADKATASKLQRNINRARGLG